MQRKDVIQILRGRYPEQEYVLLPEVRNAAGGYAERSADYIAFNLWPSRGLAVHGLEQKASRADFLKEMKDPSKAEAFYRYCDYWWLLILDEKIAKPEEVPPTWGLLTIKNGKVYQLKPASKLDPKPLDRGIIASMLRRAVADVVSKESVEDVVKQKVEESLANKLQFETSQYKRLQDKHDALFKSLRSFEQASGISIPITGYSADRQIPRIGKAVSYLASNGTDGIAMNLESTISNISKLKDRLQEVVEELKEVEASHVTNLINYPAE